MTQRSHRGKPRFAAADIDNHPEGAGLAPMRSLRFYGCCCSVVVGRSRTPARCAAPYRLRRGQRKATETSSCNGLNDFSLSSLTIRSDCTLKN